MTVVNLKSEPMNEFEPLDLVLDTADIMELIPHRYPFLLIDRLTEIVPGYSAVGIKNVSINEWFFQGHFPSHPIMPGVLIIEAMAQTAAALVIKSIRLESNTASDNANMVYFMSVDEAKFRKPVVPGDILKIKVTKDRVRGNVWRFKGQAFVDNVLVDEALFTAMIVNK